ncbi:hypothetical protein [Paenibacillus dendritiformis]|uniref:hypothetical protein n=1 Tax=Paenibacillus dendritiformis TaxID=130049 RepID=UPI0015EC8626|nr:hypothetical protein [Paenibacillus dendritiformis]
MYEETIIEGAAGRLAEEGAANPAQMQEFSLVQLLSDANPAKVHHFRRFLLSIR